MNFHIGPARLALLLLTTLAFISVQAENASGPSDDARGPDAVVRVATQALLELIDEHREAYGSDPEPYFDAVDESMAHFVDYPGIARGVMAGYWSDASEEQRERFIRTFRHGLVRSYARAMLEFDQREIEVLPLGEGHVRGDRAVVRMRVTASNGRDYPLQYSMAKLDGKGWRVRNVVVNGVNLGRTYRSQFASAMRLAEGMDAVIADWSTAPPEGLEDAADA